MFGVVACMSNLRDSKGKKTPTKHLHVEPRRVSSLLSTNVVVGVSGNPLKRVKHWRVKHWLLEPVSSLLSTKVVVVVRGHLVLDVQVAYKIYK